MQTINICKAQQIPIQFQHYTTKQGLSSAILYDIAQDKKGYLWVSTAAGINRHNGSSFTSYTHDEKDSFSLPSDKSRLCTDKHGTLWVYSENGLSYFDDLNERFVPFQLDKKAAAVHSITSVGFDNKNAIWFATEDSWLWKADSKTAMPKKIHLFEGLTVNAIFQDSENRLWVVSDDGLFLYNEQRGLATHFKDETKGAINIFFSLFEDSTHQLWVSTWGDGIKQFEPSTQRFTTYLFNNKITTENLANYAATIIQPSPKPELWITSLDPDIGISIFNTQTHLFTSINHNKDEPNSLANNASICLFKDRSNIIWYACESGLDKYDPLANRFASIQLNHIPGCAADPGLTRMAFVGQQLWVGTSDKGIYVLDNSGQKLLQTIDLAKISGLSESNFINDIYTAPNNDKLIASYQGAFLYNPKTAAIKELKTFHSSSVTTIINNELTGQYWFATKEGIIILDSLLNITDTILHGTAVNSLYQQKNGTIWIGSSKGLYSFFNSKLSVIKAENTDYKKLSDCRIFNINGDASGSLLLATSVGAMVYKPSEKKLTIYSKQSGLPHNSCYRIVSGENNTIWVLHEKGLSAINTNTGIIKNYGEAEGASAPTFANGLLEIAGNGEIYFGRYISLYHFTPDKLPENNYAAPLYITGVRLGDSLLPAHNWQTKAPLSFSYKNNSISIEYTLLNFSHAEANTYEYLLEGSNQREWISSGVRNYISYSGLPAGKYVFKVRGRNSDGIQSSNEASLSFVIVPPYWQTTWFKIVVGTVLILLLAGIILLRVQSIKKNAAIKHQMLEAEVKALRAQMNPHFIFNCMNTIDSYILQNKQMQASQLVQRFSKLTRRVLEHTSQEYICIEEEMQTLQIYLQIERMRQNDGFEFRIKTDDDTKQLLIPPMLVQPFVENAVIHGMRNRLDSGGIIVISTTVEAKNVKITVQDNGVGRSKAMEIKAAQPSTHQSISMELTISRLEALHGHKKHSSYLVFTDLGGSETGTKVEIFVPIIAEQKISISTA